MSQLVGKILPRLSKAEWLHGAVCGDWGGAFAGVLARVSDLEKMFLRERSDIDHQNLFGFVWTVFWLYLSLFTLPWPIATNNCNTKTLFFLLISPQLLRTPQDDPSNNKNKNTKANHNKNANTTDRMKEKQENRRQQTQNTAAAASPSCRSLEDGNLERSAQDLVSQLMTRWGLPSGEARAEGQKSRALGEVRIYRYNHEVVTNGGYFGNNTISILVPNVNRWLVDLGLLEGTLFALLESRRCAVCPSLLDEHPEN